MKNIQEGYKLQPLSTFLNTPSPPASPTVDFIKPLIPEAQKSSLEFFRVMNFVMDYCPTDSEEKGLMARFTKIGVGAGKDFDIESLSPEVKAALEAGIKDTWTVDFAGFKKDMEAGKVTSGDVFGTRAFLKNNYLYRMSAAVLGICGNM